MKKGKPILATFIALLVLGILPVRSQKQVTIGRQVWMTVNLNVTRFRNGDSIPEAKTPQEWLWAQQYKKPAWCYYDNNPLYKDYGILYNWYAVSDPRGLAPEGWHVPSDSEWLQLVKFLGGEKLAAVKMRHKIGWNKGENGSNASGFSALPGGYRGDTGGFQTFGSSAHWWSATGYDTNNAWYISLWPTGFMYGNYYNGSGYGVRCIRD